MAIIKIIKNIPDDTLLVIIKIVKSVMNLYNNIMLPMFQNLGFDKITVTIFNVLVVFGKKYLFILLNAA